MKITNGWRRMLNHNNVSIKDTSIQMNDPKEVAYQKQIIDCNCNNCGYLVRDFDRTKKHQESYEGTGLMDRLTYGVCSKFDKQITFIPEICMIETQECFVHRNDMK
jgi:hypothetical protein